ncbi:DNA translocase FtsK [Candidatus Babeliales bacterium]|nr:DNA translocase FtsK [Candidatus Babeliales bacterium]
MRRRSRRKSWTIPFAHELIALALSAVGVFLSLCFVSFDPYDASWFYYRSSDLGINNWCGVVGAHTTGLFLYMFGGASLVFVGFCFYAAYHIVVYGRNHFTLRSLIAEEADRLVALTLLIPILSALSALHRIDLFHDIDPGGRLGYVITMMMRPFIDRIGSFLVLYTLLTMSAILLFRVSFVRAIQFIFRGVKAILNVKWWGPPVSAVVYKGVVLSGRPFVLTYHGLRHLWAAQDAQDDISVVEFQADEEVDEVVKQVHKDAFWNRYQEQSDVVAAQAVARQHIPEETDHESVSKPQLQPRKPYRVPDASLFEKKNNQDSSKQISHELKQRASVLEEKLEQFGISGKVVTIKPGPVVTLFEYEPAIHIKLSKILALEDDLALALRATSIRILAPIPGTAVVGFEVANQKRKPVYLASIVRSHAFSSYDGELPLVLGADTVGQHVIVDLAKMPHLLVAGSTGSGKSVALNTMLISLLSSKTPDELKLILIDPKRLEFSSYADIAHLLFPIVTDTRKAIPILKWVVQHMEERYEKMASLNVRNISDYNAAVEQEDAFPFLVVVIDELADLMMTAGRDVEDHIARIAQMARAAGIHLLVATQRPSVDVITGLIKVNFPSRVSFRVTSKVDSRTILDATGADKLLGRGDMLFLDAHASHLQRVHGAYISDRDIRSIVQHIRAERAPNYLSIEEVLASHDVSLAGSDDALYRDILTYLDTVDEVSISLLQRQFRIGYNRSARIIDALEAQGKIMPADGGKTRKVIRS